MKAMIVDDEIAVREAMDLLLNWDEYGIDEVLYAENGAEALRLLEQNRIDILFCDMQMPVMDGQQLLEEIIRRELKTKIIAVSGYNDFQYVRTTLRAKGIDYVLKPLEEEKLKEALLTAVEQCRKDQAHEIMINEIEQMSETDSRHVLRDWLNGKYKYSQRVSSAMSTLKIAGEQLFTAAIVWQNPVKVREDIFDGDIGEMRKTLNSMIRQALGSSNSVLVDIDDYFQIAVISGRKVNIYPVMLQQFLKESEKNYGLIGICEFDNKGVAPEDIFRQVEILKYRILSRRVQPFNEKNRSGNRIPGIRNLEPVLLLAIRERNVAQISKVIGNYSRELFETEGLTFREVQMQTVELNLMIRHLLHEMTARPSDVGPVSTWIFDREIWCDKAQEQLYKIISYGREDSFGIEAVYRYLEEHYDQNITIAVLTERFYQSPQYLSKLFKNTYQQTIMNTLKDIRIRQAKRLLETGSCSVMEIAGMTGYEDENYFSKVFRRETGMSPRSYRRQFQE